MKRALRIAKKGEGFVIPNPMVGAIIIKNGKKIGEGFHEKYGKEHAEIMALKACEESPEGASLYITLEPCDHFGKTPPCTNAIIEAGIKKVIIASLDPVRNGVQRLKEAGIKVQTGLLEKEARRLNRAFFTFHEKKRPFITLKIASSINGKITEKIGEATSITGKLSQKLTHLLRHKHHGILIGAGTLLTDNPYLDVREINGRNPVRIVLKGKRPLDDSLFFFRDKKHIVLEEMDLNTAMSHLHKYGIQSLLVEGGAKVFTNFLDQNLWDEAKIFIAPYFFSSQALNAYFGVKKHNFRFLKSRRCGKDLLITASPVDTN